MRKLMLCAALSFASNTYAALDGLSNDSTTAVFQLLFLLAMVTAPFWLVGAFIVLAITVFSKKKPKLSGQIDVEHSANAPHMAVENSENRLKNVGKSYFLASLSLLLISILPFFHLGQMPGIVDIASNMTNSSIWPGAGIFQLLIFFSALAGSVFCFSNPESSKVRTAMYFFGFALVCFALYSMQSRIPAAVLLIPLIVGFIQK